MTEPLSSGQLSIQYAYNDLADHVSLFPEEQRCHTQLTAPDPKFYPFTN